MEKTNLKKAFREIKKAVGLQYALTNIDNLGDCMTCVGSALCEKYGDNAKGIYLKHWTRGMNKSFINFDDLDEAYICHDIDAEQFQKIKEILKKWGYIVKNKEFDEYECIRIVEA